MLNFQNDLNFLAANNVIGYDTYAQTINAVTPSTRRSGYNPYGIGKLNTGLQKDTFVNSSPANKFGTGLLAGFGFLLGSNIVSEIVKTGKSSNKKGVLSSIKKGLGKKTTKKAAAKTTKKIAQNGFKGFLSKAGKVGKGTLMIAGAGAIAAGVLNIYGRIRMSKAEKAYANNQEQPQT